MDLLEVALRFQMDRSLCARRAVVRGRTRGFHVAEFALNQIKHLLVGDVARGGDHQMIRREPVPEARAERVTAEFLTVSGVPRIGRPSGCCGQKPRVNMS